QPKSKHPQLLAKLRLLVRALRIAEQLAFRTTTGIERLIGNEDLPVEILDRSLCFSLTGLERIELAGPADYFRILTRIGGRRPRLDPVGVTRASRSIGIGHSSERESGLLARRTQRARLFTQNDNVVPDGYKGCTIGELLERDSRFNFRQVGD